MIFVRNCRLTGGGEREGGTNFNIQNKLTHHYLSGIKVIEIKRKDLGAFTQAYLLTT